MLSATLKLLSSIEDSHHGPSDAMHSPPKPFKVDPYGFEDLYKDGVEVPDSNCCSRQVKIHSRMLILDRQIDKVLKLETSRKVTIKAFKDQEKYEHVCPKVTSAQDGQCLQVDN
ncbi:hypothetical protein Tco_0656844 [Tanacetum coccineum]|uniref:Uncharacterized protein n=1 Tax=Tanacetum coccineum TaxID=301880 RepID=A0ABQ4XAL2_9ASTR